MVELYPESCVFGRVLFGRDVNVPILQQTSRYLLKSNAKGYEQNQNSQMILRYIFY